MITTALSSDAAAPAVPCGKVYVIWPRAGATMADARGTPRDVAA